ncbi:MAG: chemotaxis protein CheW [Planctomycetota bacterium]
MHDECQICTFHLDDLLLGLEVGRVQEVIFCQDVTEVPGSPPLVSGLINLRGEIVLEVDLRERLRLDAIGSTPDPQGEDASPKSVVVRRGSSAYSLKVDEIGDVLTLDTASIEPTPATVAEDIRPLLAGAYQLPGRLLLQLDVDRLLDFLIDERRAWKRPARTHEDPAALAS